MLVWLHGGGFSWGSGASVLTRGDALAARQDVVVVTLNHRLGVLGYLHHPEIDGSGVAGLLDLRLALEWVRDEIAAFGGDPGNVTIAGHSGGGAKVAGLLALPSARGLFHRAIIQSGVVSLRVIDLSEATVTAARVLAAADVRPVDVRRLQELPVEQLTRLAGPYRFRPVAEGVDLPAHPFDPVAVPTAAGLPLLIGTTAHDTATFKFDADPGWEAIDDERLLELVAQHPAAALGPAAAETVADVPRCATPRSRRRSCWWPSPPTSCASARACSRSASWRAATATVFLYDFDVRGADARRHLVRRPAEWRRTGSSCRSSSTSPTGARWRARGPSGSSWPRG